MPSNMPLTHRPAPSTVTGPNDRFTRRGFLQATAAASAGFALSGHLAAAFRRLKKPVRIGVIADLHHDVMHDGVARMKAFVKEMAVHQPDALMQLGDFAYPNERNKEVIDLFNQAHKQALHVIGNHDTDAGHTRQQCLDNWTMPSRYYARNIGGIWFLVLDGNDKGSPTHKGGYASYIGNEQTKWLKEQLANLEGPVIVVSHQPLAGSGAVDNAVEMQNILGEASDKVLLALNGHTHIDDLLRIKHVTYLHVNSASYQWVGSEYAHESYSKEVHAKHPSISRTCPYRDSLFAMLTIDPQNLMIRVQGRESEWVGQSPIELGADQEATLTHGEEIAPRIRDRRIMRR